MNSVVICTGGFSPIHSGHIAYLNAAKLLGNVLVVGVNSDDWLMRKTGQVFMPASERIAVLENLKSVDHCILFDDSDNTAIEAIKNVRLLYPHSRIIFANGGDRTETNIPEMAVAGIEFAFGVGGNAKLNSSSWILAEFKAPKTIRSWGYYRILHDVAGTKVKELTIEPGKSLSMQRHFSRSEYWHVSEGKCVVNNTVLLRHDNYAIPSEEWHQLSNPYDRPCQIVEIQYGDICAEDDIERK